MENDEQKILYYADELNDEFTEFTGTAKRIDENFKYVNNSKTHRLIHFMLYKFLEKPVAKIYWKAKFHNKIINKNLLKNFKDTGVFLYGNHTQQIGDVLMPCLVSSPKYAYIIVHPNNISIKGIGGLINACGAIPLPDTIAATKNFIDAIETRIKQKQAVVIYPEAHIWPYYTKIRPFKSASFRYPVKLGVPTFAFTNTYVHRGKSKTPQIITYIDGPFYPNKDLPVKEQIEDLRNQVYNAMSARSKLSNFETIKYLPKTKTDENSLNQKIKENK